LINLFDKSKGELNEQEQTQLSELLCEFENVFAKSEFDLGILGNSNNPYLVINAVLKQFSGFIFTCQYAELASSLEYFEGHLVNLRAVLVRLREHGLKLKPKKCELFQKEVEFLGRVVGPRGIYIGPEYIKDIKN
jgi:hypothetical protein